MGASGFVGRLTAAHLADHAPAGLRIGLAGRSPERLTRTRDDLGLAAQDWPLITVDVTDSAAATELAGRARVVVSTVGPYLRYGLPLVTACATVGTAYADLTGETLFVRRSIDAADALARTSGARVVHACGFDSVPSDLGVGLNAARAAADGEGQLVSGSLQVRSMRGGISGGTVDSLRQQIIEIRSDQRLRALAADPRALSDGDGSPTDQPGRRAAPLRRSGSGVRQDPRTGRWQAPFVMGGFNRQIVLRSRGLMRPDSDSGTGPGSRFRYGETVDTGAGLLGALRAGLIAAGSTALMAGLWFPSTQRLLDRVLPDPGAGPSQATRQRGRFAVEVVCETSTGASYRTRVGAEVDPGYDGTAIMLGEAGLALAEDVGLAGRAGVLTPMTALGAPYAERLRRHGFTITTERIN